MRYSLKDAAELLGQSVPRTRRLAAGAGLGDDTGQFGFQDLVVLRALVGLAARVSPYRVHSALRRLRAHTDAALGSLRFDTAGNRIIVRDCQGVYDPFSGQRLLDFAPTTPVAPITVLTAVQAAAEPPTIVADGEPMSDDPERLFELALALEDHDLEAAIEVYRRLIIDAPERVDAHINLGRLHHERGELEAAESFYRRGVHLAPDDGIVWFNLGVLLDDRGEHEPAISAYRRALELDSHNADAHFNLARLLERAGDELSAMRHLVQYRQLQKS